MTAASPQAPANDLLTELGTWIAGVEFEQIPPQVVSTAQLAIMDLLGAAVAAQSEPIMGVVTTYLGGHPGSGTATVIGVTERYAPETAAFVNGALAHALDFDDGNDTMAGHPSAPVFPAVLALGEERASTGRDLLAAYAVGFEVEAKIGKIVNPEHYDHGWHPTATLGAFGSAAASSWLLGLDAAACTRALAIAAASSAGIKASFGSMAKPIQVGRAAGAGLTAARLAHAGATARADAFVAKQGYARVHDGLEPARLAERTLDLGSPWDLDRPGVVFKLYPSCGGTHSAVEAANALKGRVDPAEIVSVSVRSHPIRFIHTDRATVNDGSEARFSLQYAVAVALLRGEVALESFTDDAVRSDEMRAMLAKVTGEPLAPSEYGPDRYAAVVDVQLRDGTTLSSRVERAQGADSPIPDSALRAKFLANVRSVADASSADALLAVLDRMPLDGTAASLAGALRGASAAPSS